MTKLLSPSVIKQVESTNKFIDTIQSLIKNLPATESVLQTTSLSVTSDAVFRYADVLKRVKDFRRLLTVTIAQLESVDKQTIDDFILGDQASFFKSLLEDEVLSQMDETRVQVERTMQNAIDRQRMQIDNESLKMALFNKMLDDVRNCGIYLDTVALALQKANLNVKKHYSELVKLADKKRYNGEKQIKREEKQLAIDVESFATLRLSTTTEEFLKQMQRQSQTDMKEKG